MRAAPLVCLSTALCLGSVSPLLAQDPPPEPVPWRLELGFSLVATSGNSDTSSAGLDLSYDHRWDGWALDAEGKGLRASEDGEKTAERYRGRLRGKRRLSESVELTLGVRASRDRFAGIDLRTVAEAGVLWTIVDDERWTASASAGLSWNHEDRADETRSFAGALTELKAKRALTASSHLSARAAFFPDFEESNNYRAEGSVSLQATVISKLALKVTYEVVYANEPPEGFETTDSSLNVSLVLGLGRDKKS